MKTLLTRLSSGSPFYGKDIEEVTEGVDAKVSRSLGTREKSIGSLSSTM
jgi:hypothetical protein